MSPAIRRIPLVAPRRLPRASQRFALATRRHGDVLHLTARGEIDLAATPELLRAVARAADSGCGEVHVDLSRVTFMDSAGCNFLAALCRKVPGAQVVVYDPPATGERAMHATGLDEVIPVQHGRSPR